MNYPRGNCYFYVSDYKHLKPNKDKDAVLYWDNNHNAFFIRCFDAVSSLTTPKPVSAMQKVKVRISPGCLSINGQSYMIDRDSDDNISTKSPLLFEGKNEKLESINQLKQLLATRATDLKNSNNLFVCNDELKIIVKHIAKLEKRINEQEIRTINL